MYLIAESRAAGRGAMRSSRFVVLLLLVVVGAIVLRVWARGGRSLWFDEAFSWRLASFPWSELIGRAALDNNPPLYYLLLKCWMLAFGESPTALSSLSVVLSGAACAALFAFVCEAYRPLDKRWMALVAAALLATNGFHIYWGRQVRMYALVTALAACSSWLLLRAMHAREHRLRKWLLYAIVALLFAYSHTYALFSLAAQGLFVAGMLAAGTRSRLSLRENAPIPGAKGDDGSRPAMTHVAGPLLAASVVAAGWLPWLPVLLRQHAQVHDTFWLPPLSWWDVRSAWHTLISGPAGGGGGTVHNMVSIAPLAAMLLLLWRPRASDWLVLLAATVPFAAGIAISAVDRNILEPRYLIAAQPFILVAVAKMIVSVPRPRLRAAVASLVILFSVVLNREVVGARPAIPSGIRAAAAYLDAVRKNQSPVIGTCPFFYLPLVYNLHDHDHSFLFDGGLPIPHYEGTAALAGDEMVTGQQLAAIDSPQVFVVSNLCPLANQTGIVTVPDHWRLVRRTEFQETYGLPGTLTVAEYQTR